MEEIDLTGNPNKILGLEPESQQLFGHFKILKMWAGKLWFVLEYKKKYSYKVFFNLI